MPDFVKFEKEYIHQPLMEILNVKGVEGLVPFNPAKLPGYIAGSIGSQNLVEVSDLVSKPVHNLQVMNEYLRTGHNRSHTMRRIAEVAVDTARINVVAQSPGPVGPYISGNLANDAASKYVQKNIRDLKLVDCVKQKAIRNDFIKRHGGRVGEVHGGLDLFTTHGNFSQVKLNNTATNLTTTNAPASNNTSRSLFSRKFFSGGGRSGFIPTVSISVGASAEKWILANTGIIVGVFGLVVVISGGIYLIKKRRCNVEV
jgi:hypothetical protein